MLPVGIIKNPFRSVFYGENHRHKKFFFGAHLSRTARTHLKLILSEKTHFFEKKLKFQKCAIGARKSIFHFYIVYWICNTFLKGSIVICSESMFFDPSQMSLEKCYFRLFFSQKTGFFGSKQHQKQHICIKNYHKSFYERLLWRLCAYKNNFVLARTYRASRAQIWN